MLPENAVLQRWRTILESRQGSPGILEANGAVSRTFRDIETEAQELEAVFARFPVRSVVAVQIGNHPSWPAALVALFRRGLVPLPLGRHVEGAELDAALVACRVAALLTIEEGIPRVTARPSVPPLSNEAAADFLKLTSGTTSAPRAIAFQAHQLLADCDNICATMGIADDDLNFGVIPFSHSYGFSNLISPLLCRGVPLVASEDRLPRAILHGLEQSGATVFPGMPVFFEKLAALEPACALGRLRLCMSAGAPLPPATALAFTKRFAIKIHGFYGSSECGGIAYDASDLSDWKPGFVGTPMHGVEVARATPGEGPSRIVVRSAAVGDGYFPEAEDSVLGGGRFIPGDLVEFDGPAMVITGRSSDIINVAGRKLNPAEVEARVSAFPGVRQAVMFGVPSRLRGEEPVLCVAGDDLDSAALLRFCRQSLSEWQLPRDVWIVPEIASNERGKISRRTLAARYLAARA